MLRRCLHTPTRTYQHAVASLNSLQSNAATIREIRKLGRGANKLSIPETLEWLSKAGYYPEDFNSLNAVHVSGTKGKGSTSAFVSSILEEYTKSDQKNAPTTPGLYTSPHIRFVRERIQLHNNPISEADFASFFFQIWDRLCAAGDGLKPTYFRFLTIMALHVFRSMRVDSAVIECGIGGEYDSTNILRTPTVTAVTALGIDHQALLGNTLEEIAWHKAGIFKPCALALTVSQPTDAMNVLRSRAKEKGVDLHIVKIHPEIESGAVKLGLSADYQRSNASLAVAIASEHLRSLGCTNIPDLVQDSHASLPQEFKNGLESVRWPGRGEVRPDKGSNTTWYLDGAHTPESIELAANWFAENVGYVVEPRERVLIFNQQTRDATGLARVLYKSLKQKLGNRPFGQVIFTTNVTSQSAGYKPDLLSINNDIDDIHDMKVQKELQTAWRELDPDCTTYICPTIDKAIAIARDSSRNPHVLVTGSLHLVGGIIDVLESSGEARA
jgi:folylpolyglutamate synthase